MSDVRLAIRQLLRNPGFTAVAVLTLAVGIGANTAIFSVLNGIVFQPLPFAEPERLVQILKSTSWHGRLPHLGREEIIAWQKANPVLEGVAAYDRGRANLSGCGEAARIRLLKADRWFLPLLGITPILGRNFVSEEDRWGGPSVVLVTHEFWRRRFDGSKDVLGKPVTLNNISYSVIGVLPEGFRFPGDYEVIVPLGLGVSAIEEYRRTGSITIPQAIGRLKPGISLDQGQDALNAIFQAVRRSDDRGKISLENLREWILGGAHSHNVRVLFWIVTMVLFIVCCNVANLLLVRAAGRQKEMAIRSSMGASRWRIIRQLLIESGVLSLLGGAFGLLVAVWGLHLLSPLVATFPQVRVFRIDGWVFCFAFLIALATGIVFGLAPALSASKISLQPLLSSGNARLSAGPSRRSIQDIFVVTQIAVALILLLGTGLFLSSMRTIGRFDPGFKADRALSFSIALSRNNYPDEPSQAAFFERVIDRVGSLPGVEALGAGLGLPLKQGYAGTSIEWDGLPGKAINVSMSIVNPGFFSVLDIPLKSGRAFSIQDQREQLKVVMVNEAFVRAFSADQNVLGRKLAYETNTLAIIGVAGDLQSGPTLKGSPLVYFPWPLMGSADLDFVVRTRGEPLAMAGAIRQAVAEIDPTQPMHDIRTMRQRLADTVAFERMFLHFFEVFTGIAVFLAGLGIYGVIAYAVAQRTGEIGIRMALGARQGDVLALVLRRGLVLASSGTAIGVLGGLGLTQFIIREMYGMSTRDPLMFAAVTAVLVIIAFLASLLPAHRATRVDPAVALRCE
ncbi:MAG TPA: ABC transporter permease [Candidatus Paceibacterota bacterium]|nr:ABC transporter permease [Verrucomicrobiota bacterium]HRY51378.1 ABC transporter permease [Candidatus Paceibacterota bacterium]